MRRWANALNLSTSIWREPRTAAIVLASILCKRQMNSHTRTSTCDYIWSPVRHNREHTHTHDRNTFSDVNQIYLSVNLRSMRSTQKQRDSRWDRRWPNDGQTYEQTSKLHFKTNAPSICERIEWSDGTQTLQCMTIECGARACLCKISGQS